ncbi:MAG TPA: TIGR03619 family F420-dependent LLM class oxidoreductase [Mycobacteriales bacterium]|nr:TIGR03619 family F420-dependent LLM class oxidoreductase [Mycobacteriales bacterium]
MTPDLPLIGFGLPVSGSWATPATMTAVARRAEELGYASLWSFQRVLFPAGGGLGPMYRSVHDPVVPLAHVAAVTDRIRLGTAIINAPFSSPALLAKSLTSLDVVSGGRLDAGLGLGWAEDEYTAAGVPFEKRGARMDEYLRVLTALWTEDPVAFDGEFYTVPASRVSPAPVQRPHPPLLLGGGAPAALRRAGRLTSGWISSSRQDLTSIGESIAVVREGAEQAGRDPDAVRAVVRGLVDLLDHDPGAGRRPLQGTRDQVLDDLRDLAAQGVTEVFLDLNFSPRVGDPDVDAGPATSYAHEVLEAFAPAG